MFGVKQSLHRPHDAHSVALGTNGVRVGAGSFLVIGGPCAVESRDGLMRIASSVAQSGGGMLRGGAFKPRTSPHSFQGLGDDALELLNEARELTGLPVVTEVLDPRDAERVAQVADMLQVGARNMSNGALLRQLAKAGRPVLLKRGFGATISELLDAAEYLLDAGCEDVVLVERGIRTFETATRFTLDIAAVPVLRERTHLPILIDPSHPAGVARWVPDLARAAAAVGADGIMVEVHDDPANAMSDGAQALQFDEFAALVESIDAVLAAVGHSRSVPNVEHAAHRAVGASA
jgi:3-deoxy-7-phosphoheptulonate synthase